MRSVTFPNGLEVACYADIEVGLEDIAELGIWQVCDALTAELSGDACLFVSIPRAEDALGIDIGEARLRFPEHHRDSDLVAVEVHDRNVTLEVLRPAVNTAGLARQLVERTVGGSALTVRSIEITEFDVDGEGCIASFSVTHDVSIGQLASECHRIFAALRGHVLPLENPYQGFQYLSQGQWHSFIGCAETDWLEVKSQMYGLESAKQRFELGLDVASFANSDSGGLMVIGFSTSKDAHDRDIVTDVRGATRLEGSVSRISDILHELLYPHPKGLRVEVFKLDGRDALAILVPPQAGSLRPFIVAGTLVSTEGYSGAGFTWVERIGTSKRAKTAAEIHGLLRRDGLGS